MDAVIFDMDGVIVDSETYWHEEAKTIFKHAIADDIDPEETFDHVTGMYIGDIYGVLTDKYEMTVTKDEFLAMYYDRAEAVYTEKVECMDNFEDILWMLQEAGVALAIASSSPKQWIEWVLERFELGDFFEAVVSAEDIDAPSKPDPTIYRHAAEQIGVPPDRCVVVEDSHHGAVAAKKAGMICIGFRAAHNADQDLDVTDTIVNSPGALRQALADYIEPEYV